MSSSDSLDARVLKALGHPLRLLLVELITERGEASPTELARTLRFPLATVSHHVRFLRDLGYLELTRTEPRRGAVEHFYQVVTPPFIADEQWEQLSVAVRRGLAGQTLRRIFRAASAAGSGGGFDDRRAHIDRMLLDLDAEARRELSEALVDVLRLAQVIQRRSDARQVSDGSAATRRSELAILHFGVGDEGVRHDDESHPARLPPLP
jgi:DNA-binding transcriptional ArsR family regulator